MEKPISCKGLEALGEEEITEQFDVIHDLTHRTLVGDSEFAYIDRDKFKEKTDLMTKKLKGKLKGANGALSP